MPKYKFIYNVSEGIFQMDVFTGMYILADNQFKALESASRLDIILSNCYKFTAILELIPSPRISVNCIRLIDGYKLDAQILKYQVQKKSSSELFDDDFRDISEKAFFEEIQDYFKNINSKHPISFDAISYEIQEVSSHFDNHLVEYFSIP